VLALVQRGAGNASVSRMIARQAEAATEAEQVAEGTPAVAPHDPGDRSEDLHELAGSGGGLASAFGGKPEAAPGDAGRGPDIAGPVEAPKEAPGAPTAQPDGGEKDKPKVPQEVTDWFAEQPEINSSISEWLVRAKEHGFLTFLSGFYERQIRDIAAGRTRVSVITSLGGAVGTMPVDPDGRLGVLIILESLARSHARRWMADPSKTKGVVEAGDLLRNLGDASVADAHAGPSADLYRSFDWDGANGPIQVLQALGDLPAGNYRIGLPFQGEFFPPARYLANRQAAAIRAAGAGGTPADITEPSMIKFRNHLYTSTWNPTKQTRTRVGGYDDRNTGRQHGGAAELGSADLARGIVDLATQGIRITAVFADNNNHIHITRD
jgi:hypothetical protein